MRLPQQPVPAWAYDPFKGNGRILYAYPDKVVWGLALGEQMVTCVQRRVDPILDDNQEAYNNNAGKRWGDGQVAAAVPLNIQFDKILPARRNGDEKWIKKFLNDSDNRKFRRFPGNI